MSRCKGPFTPDVLRLVALRRRSTNQRNQFSRVGLRILRIFQISKKHDFTGF